VYYLTHATMDPYKMDDTRHDIAMRMQNVAVVLMDPENIAPATIIEKCNAQGIGYANVPGMLLDSYHELLAVILEMNPLITAACKDNLYMTTDGSPPLFVVLAMHTVLEYKIYNESMMTEIASCMLTWPDIMSGYNIACLAYNVAAGVYIATANEMRISQSMAHAEQIPDEYTAELRRDADEAMAEVVRYTKELYDMARFLADNCRISSADSWLAECGVVYVRAMSADAMLMRIVMNDTSKQAVIDEYPRAVYMMLYMMHSVLPHDADRATWLHSMRLIGKDTQGSCAEVLTRLRFVWWSSCDVDNEIPKTAGAEASRWLTLASDGRDPGENWVGQFAEFPRALCCMYMLAEGQIDTPHDNDRAMQSARGLARRELYHIVASMSRVKLIDDPVKQDIADVIDAIVLRERCITANDIEVLTNAPAGVTVDEFDEVKLFAKRLMTITIPVGSTMFDPQMMSAWPLLLRACTYELEEAALMYLVSATRRERNCTCPMEDRNDLIREEDIIE